VATFLQGQLNHFLHLYLRRLVVRLAVRRKSLALYLEQFFLVVKPEQRNCGGIAIEKAIPVRIEQKNSVRAALEQKLKHGPGFVRRRVGVITPFVAFTIRYGGTSHAA
jgi:hypothetical protein